MSTVESLSALELVIRSAATFQDDLTSAVERIREFAVRHRQHGILVTRRNPSTYTVAVSTEVPYGETWERWS